MGSITFQMWVARHQLIQYIVPTLRNCFRSWAHITTFQLFHARIRKFSKLNKRNRLELFMQESADLTLRYKILDWRKRIYSLCFK